MVGLSVFSALFSSERASGTSVSKPVICPKWNCKTTEF